MQPFVRHLITCEDIQAASTRERFTLVQVITRIRSLESVPFPLLFQELCILAICTECRGQGRIQIRIVEEESDMVCRKSPQWPVTFANDPLQIIGLPFRIRDVEFPRPGVYSVQLWYNGVILAEEPLRLSE